MERIELRASASRRAVAVGVVGAMGFLLWSLALEAADTPAFAALFFAAGLAALWGAWVLWRVTAGGLVWTGDAIETDRGEVLARLDEITAVDRGAFAFKPSSGFVLKLADKSPMRWAPGLWWRMGRRMGVGGATASAPAKAMAEVIAFKLAERP